MTSTEPSLTAARPWPPWLAPALLALLLGVYAITAASSVGHINTLWDEANDHQAVLALLQHPLTGSGIDGSQARLPMYATAAAYALSRPDLAVARWLSLAVGGLAIVLTWHAGRQWFGPRAALLAAALLAISPYFLGFARTALTEGDAFCPASVLLLLLCFAQFTRRPCPANVAWLGLASGLVVATKFQNAILLLPLLLTDLARPPGVLAPRGPRPPWTLGVGPALAILAAGLTQLKLAQLPAMLCWVGSLACLAAGLVQLTRARTVPMARTWAWPTVLALTALVVAAFPEHVLNAEVPRALLRRAVRHDHVEPMAWFYDPARLYSGVILLKMGLLLGLISVAALGWAALRSPRDQNLRLLINVVGLYLLALLLLPIRQTFYLMSVYPPLLLLVAAFMAGLARRLSGRPALQSAWVALCATACLYGGWLTARIYPEFGYVGYEAVGDRWLGAESRGYRNLVQVTNDGTSDALAWLDSRVPPGRRVISLLRDEHVVDSWLAMHPPSYALVRRSQLGIAVDARPLAGPVLEDADYLVVALNNQVGFDEQPTPIELQKAGLKVVHAVWRGRGPYRLPVVTIYGPMEPRAD